MASSSAAMRVTSASSRRKRASAAISRTSSGLILTLTWDMTARLFTTIRAGWHRAAGTYIMVLCSAPLVVYLCSHERAATPSPPDGLRPAGVRSEHPRPRRLGARPAGLGDLGAHRRSRRGRPGHLGAGLPGLGERAGSGAGAGGGRPAGGLAAPALRGA